MLLESRATGPSPNMSPNMSGFVSVLSTCTCACTCTVEHRGWVGPLWFSSAAAAVAPRAPAGGTWRYLNASGRREEWGRLEANCHGALVGLDTSLSILDALYDEFRDANYAAVPLLRRMVAAGHLGRKTKQGFRSY